jgi:uncharacterized protein YebE (UPF0316 family)
MMNTFVIGLIIFVVASMINVILSTMKTIWTVKGSRLQAIIINILTYSVYTLVIKQIANTNLWIAVAVTALTNLFGVWIARILIDKMSKDNVWKIEIVCPTNLVTAITDTLEFNEIGYNLLPITTKYGDDTNITVFSKSKHDSEIIKESIQGIPVKYNITELSLSL